MSQLDLSKTRYKHKPYILRRILNELLDELKIYTKMSNEEFENVEYGGLICEHKNKLHLELVKGTPTEVEIPDKCKKGKIIAEFHTHPNEICLLSNGDISDMLTRKKPNLLSAYRESYSEDYTKKSLLQSEYNFLFYNPKNHKNYRVDIIESNRT